MNILRAVWLIWLLLLAGCTAASLPATHTPPPPATLCVEQHPATNNPAQCTALNTQTAQIEALSGTQATYRTEDFSLTLDGLITLRYEAEQVSIFVEEGSAVLSTESRLRTLRSGEEVVLQQRMPQTQRTSAPTTVPPTRTPASECAAPPDWEGIYTVQRGDTLGSIAQRHDVLVAALIAANCLANPNAIQPGDVLIVPQSLAPDTTPTSPYIVFVADSYVVNAGECTTLRWEVPSAESVTLNGEDIALMGSRPLCPDADTDYTLIVQLPGEVTVGRTISISVRTP